MWPSVRSVPPNTMSGSTVTTIEVGDVNIDMDTYVHAKSAKRLHVDYTSSETTVVWGESYVLDGFESSRIQC